MLCTSIYLLVLPAAFTVSLASCRLCICVALTDAAVIRLFTTLSPSSSADCLRSLTAHQWQFGRLALMLGLWWSSCWGWWMCAMWLLVAEGLWTMVSLRVMKQLSRLHSIPTSSNSTGTPDRLTSAIIKWVIAAVVGLVSWSQSTRSNSLNCRRLQWNIALIARRPCNDFVVLRRVRNCLCIII